MPTYTKTAEDVINAVIQDSQVQTTNRTALLDYVNRTCLRILRESQWMFLQSGYQKFITKMGVTKYWIGDGPPPPGVSNTQLQLSDLESVLPESVFDLTHARPLSQDSPQVKFTLPYVQQDGTMRLGPPRGYSYYQQEPGVVTLFPPPDNQNVYYPVPNPSLCENIAGGVLPGRTYYIQTSFVDTTGGEGTPSEIFSQYVPANSLLLVSAPDPEVPSATSPSYAFWNVYISDSEGGPFLRQNVTPNPIGGPWLEPTSGASPNPGLGTSILLGNSDGSAYYLKVSTSGILSTVAANFQAAPFSVYALDAYSQAYSLSANDEGQVVATLIPFAQATSNLLLSDSSGEAWKVTINDAGQAVTLDVGRASQYAINSIPPVSSPTITPLNGYVIAFRYQKVKQLITSPTDTLQIPDAYFDVVVAGVNYLTSAYTAKGDDENFKAPMWKKEFNDGLAQIRRDLRINYRNTDFIGPDRTTQTDPYKSVWMYVF